MGGGEDMFWGGEGKEGLVQICRGTGMTEEVSPSPNPLPGPEDLHRASQACAGRALTGFISILLSSVVAELEGESSQRDRRVF